MDREKAIAKLAGQCATLGIALHVLLKSHPEREKIAASLHAEFESAISKALSSTVQDGFVEGMQMARDIYLLKK